MYCHSCCVFPLRVCLISSKILLPLESQHGVNVPFEGLQTYVPSLCLAFASQTSLYIITTTLLSRNPTTEGCCSRTNAGKNRHETSGLVRPGCGYVGAVRRKTSLMITLALNPLTLSRPTCVPPAQHCHPRGNMTSVPPSAWASSPPGRYSSLVLSNGNAPVGPQLRTLRGKMFTGLMTVPQ